MLPRALGSSRLAPAALLSSRAVSTTRYRTTRGGQSGVPFDAVVLQGLGHDGGLFVPETIPYRYTRPGRSGSQEAKSA